MDNNTKNENEIRKKIESNTKEQNEIRLKEIEEKVREYLENGESIPDDMIVEGMMILNKINE